MTKVENKFKKQLFFIAILSKIANIYLCTSTKTNLKIHPSDQSLELSLPYVDGGIKAGFPSPAQDYMENTINLNQEYPNFSSAKVIIYLCISG